MKTEDIIRDEAGRILGFDSDVKNAKAGVGQITTFNQLGFNGVIDKPDGWYLPNNTEDVAIILETKAENIDLDSEKCENEIKKNCNIAIKKYSKVIGLLYNGRETRCFKNNEEIKVPSELQDKKFYLDLFTLQAIDKEKIYAITMRINNCLHSEFGIKNLYHRMIFTACALVAKRYGAFMVDGMDYSTFHNSILSCLNRKLKNDNQNSKMELLTEVYSEIRMNLNVNSEDANAQRHVRGLIGQFIGWVSEISEYLDSTEWNGEDVMGIFFNEFNRYKKKSESGQIFTPDHITDFMYDLIGVTQNDYVLDATCGSGAFLTKAMANMMKESGGPNTAKAEHIKSEQLFGIEYDREIYALACANMLIHRDGKTNLAQMDTRTKQAYEWIHSKRVTKVLMNPPYETKYGCLEIVRNVLDAVNPGAVCAFIMPDKKLEKGSKSIVKDILSNHRILEIIKMPTDLFFNVGVETSIFVFKAFEPQKDNEIFTYYLEDDGLETVKNKGRHDVKNRWGAIKQKTLDDIRKKDNGKWISPKEHLSYQMPEKPFEISEEDFKKTAMDYICFKKGIDTKEFGEKLLNAALYGSEVTSDESSVNIKIGGGRDD